MIRLPYDYWRCASDGCPLAPRCARKQPGRQDGPQPIALPEVVGCDDFIDQESVK